jgi:serine protease Do
LRERIQTIKEGVVISSIVSDGPASKSELKANDIIVAVDGANVGTPQQLRAQIRHKPIGEPVTLDVFRKDKMVQLKVSPGEWAESTNTLASARRSPEENSFSALGLTVHALTDEIAEKFGIEMTQGVVVVAVEKGMPAGVRGMKPGDVITSVDQKTHHHSKGIS